MSKENGTISAVEAATAIAEDKRQREQEATKEVEAVLQKYNCHLEASVLLRSGQVIPQIAIIAKD